MRSLFICAFLLLCQGALTFAQDECPVCNSVIQKFADSLTDKEKKNTDIIEQKFQEYCDAITENKDAKFCYYTTGATSMKREISKPLSAGFPVSKICQKLSKKDGAICELTYKKIVTIDISKMDEETIAKKRTKDLKKILQEHDTECIGCVEKEDYVKKVMEVKASHYKEEL
mmetsp:Transcript_3933/g.4424  ORF Transcript_3933/g.4424 Transcript_3933/m.4424 type:complete len:172 (-) Transcript_3933:151-666(-)|eukprot:CAMPEP_0197847352 /NCGR_PEP_ID=MMETSP1438-20131217/5775_1 /TAXON_ID=1461541 /ORGANISM="Pterosperma sp., Strain CCMP1384" /LENGTH=171 /DNA_ID=CAMNT_0043459243 /DNA_START=128 /DNA_END=643 /DNA_ORIENTATION=+